MDSVVVEQRIDGLGLGGRLQLVHLAAELGAPLRDFDREKHVDHQSAQRGPHVPHLELDPQQEEHQGHLDERGKDAVQRVGNERLHPARAAVDVTRHAAGLAFQMETQAQLVQVAEHLQRNAARGPLGGLGENKFTQFSEQAGGKPQQSVGQQQPHRHHQQRSTARR
jgi:hypothetical protein